MKIIVSNNSSIPIYEQIKNTIINQILSGDLREDEQLPSIRSLAQDTKISIMTIKKAYDELENDGYITTRQGKGSFIAPKNIELAREQIRKEIEESMINIIEKSNNYGISKQELLELFEYLMESEEK